MTSYKIRGIEEIMLHYFDMDVSEFFKINLAEIRNVIDNNRIDKSLRAFIISEEKLEIGDEKKIRCINQYSEKNYLPTIEKNKIRIVSWEGLEKTNIKIDIADSVKEVTLKIEGNTYGCMDEWGNKTFTDYTFYSDKKKIDNCFFESESYGNIKEKVYYFINDRNELGSIGQEENFKEELSEIINTLR